MEDGEEDPLKSRAAAERPASTSQSVGGAGSLGASPVPPFASPPPNPT